MPWGAAIRYSKITLGKDLLSLCMEYEWRTKFTVCLSLHMEYRSITKFTVCLFIFLFGHDFLRQDFTDQCEIWHKTLPVFWNFWAIP